YGIQWKLALDRVNHVRGYSVQAVEQTYGAESCSCKIAAHGETTGQQSGDQQLKNCAAPKHWLFAQPPEEQMPAFMNGQMDVVEQRGFGEVPCQIQEKQSVETQPQHHRHPRYRLPLDFRQMHNISDRKSVV